MRQSLLTTFSEIFILDLHGGAKKKEKTPQGGADENVFDIMQGVSIGIFVKRKGATGPAKVRHADLWGARTDKYDWLTANSLSTTQWTDVNPTSPFYLLRPQSTQWLAEYEKGWKLTDIFPVNVLGFQTHRDGFAVDFERSAIERRIRDLRDPNITDDQLRDRYLLKDNRDWQLASSRAVIRADTNWQAPIIECDYRPFDRRYCYFSRAVMDYPRRELLDHVAGKDNLSLLASRQQATVGFRHAWVAEAPAESCLVSSTTREQNYAFPLYVYPSDTSRRLSLEDDPWPADTTNAGRRPNISPAFIKVLSAATGLHFIPEGGRLLTNAQYGPTDVLGYLYAILQCPSYRQLFEEYLRMDFPRLPITTDVSQFRDLCRIGKELIDLHAMKAAPTPQLQLRFPVAGDNVVARRHVRFEPPTNNATGRVYVNADQYVEGVTPEVWEYVVGGFQVAEKWLKDRADRALDYDDLTRYQNALQAVARTIDVIAEIDELIPTWPIK